MVYIQYCWEKRDIDSCRYGSYLNLPALSIEENHHPETKRHCFWDKFLEQLYLHQDLHTDYPIDTKTTWEIPILLLGSWKWKLTKAEVPVCEKYYISRTELGRFTCQPPVLSDFCCSGGRLIGQPYAGNFNLVGSLKSFWPQDQVWELVCWRLSLWSHGETLCA